jgi:hypothetical protein
MFSAGAHAIRIWFQKLGFLFDLSLNWWLEMNKYLLVFEIDHPSSRPLRAMDPCSIRDRLELDHSSIVCRFRLVGSSV